MGKIMDFLIPKEKKFIKMLMLQSDILMQGAFEFNDLITNFNKMDRNSILQKRNLIKYIEHRGDSVTRMIVDGLHEALVTPIDREDILSLTQTMDDVLDFIHETTTKIVIYKVGKMPHDVSEFSMRILECCRIIKESMHHLQDYSEIKKAVIQLHNIEFEADKLFFKAVGDMFEKDHKPKDIIIFKEIYESVEEAIDLCKKVASILEQIVVKHG